VSGPEYSISEGNKISKMSKSQGKGEESDDSEEIEDENQHVKSSLGTRMKKTLLGK